MHARTPLRRVSQGSLSALARSGNSVPGSTGLEFLAPAMVELADETSTLIANIDGLNTLSDSLDAFNEAFSSYLFAMKMNTLCVEWPEAPTPESFRLRMKDLERAQNAIHFTLPPLPASPTVSDEGVAEPSYLVPSAPPVEDKGPPISNVPSKPIPKGGSKPKLTAKEKKARDMWMERLLDLAPVDFRGRDATLRNAAEGVIVGLMEATTGLRPADLVRMPTLTPVLVNKCLMALVGAKVVNKVTSKGVAVYSLSDLAWKSQRNDAR